MSETRGDAVQQLSAYVRFMQDEGDGDELVSPELLTRLNAMVEPAVPEGHAVQPELPRPMPPAPPNIPSEKSLSDDDRRSALQDVAEEAATCTLCTLHASRTNVVPGQGSLTPEIVFVGEGPGQEEDRQGLAFVGRAGQLLTRMIEAMGYTRETVYIANIVKCHPPRNRAPAPDEMGACMPFLKRQIRVLQPRIIVALGATASQALLETTEGIARLRGRWQRFEGIDVMPTFHPADLLRNPNQKRPVWEDLKAVLGRLGRAVPKH